MKKITHIKHKENERKTLKKINTGGLKVKVWNEEYHQRMNDMYSMWTVDLSVGGVRSNGV